MALTRGIMFTQDPSVYFSNLTHVGLESLPLLSFRIDETASENIDVLCAKRYPGCFNVRSMYPQLITLTVLSVAVNMVSEVRLKQAQVMAKSSVIASVLHRCWSKGRSRFPVASTSRWSSFRIPVRAKCVSTVGVAITAGTIIHWRIQCSAGDLLAQQQKIRRGVKHKISMMTTLLLLHDLSLLVPHLFCMSNAHWAGDGRGSRNLCAMGTRYPCWRVQFVTLVNDLNCGMYIERAPCTSSWTDVRILRTKHESRINMITPTGDTSRNNRTGWPNDTNQRKSAHD